LGDPGGIPLTAQGEWWDAHRRAAEGPPQNPGRLAKAARAPVKAVEGQVLYGWLIIFFCRERESKETQLGVLRKGLDEPHKATIH